MPCVMRVNECEKCEKKTTQIPKSIKKKKKPQIAAKIVQSLDELWRSVERSRSSCGLEPDEPDVWKVKTN